MALNLKNDDTTDLVRELATTTGESLTTAVHEAVRERLDRLRSDRSPATAEELLDIGRDAARRLEGAGASIDHDALYGEDGLPR